jgi:prophage DNA circulation protein
MQQLASLRKRGIGLVTDAAVLAREPLDLYDEIKALFDDVEIPAKLGIDALLDAYAEAATVARPSDSRADECDVYDTLTEIMRLTPVVHAAMLAPAAEFVSYDEATDARDRIADALDALSASTDDALFAALEQLRADLVRSVPGESSTLPRIIEHTPPVTVPSLVLSHRLYGSVEREADIIARNGIARPGFVVGGTALEALSDG